MSDHISLGGNMANSENKDITGNTIVNAKQKDGVATLVLDDGTVITFSIDYTYDQVLGHSAKLKVDVI